MIGYMYWLYVQICTHSMWPAGMLMTHDLCYIVTIDKRLPVLLMICCWLTRIDLTAAG
eukprot:COSAG01_NODE_14279_length_1473_cov_2.910480_2_plen_58_part_00